MRWMSRAWQSFYSWIGKGAPSTGVALEPSAYQDQQLVCRDCGEAFIFTADDQAYLARRGYYHIHIPKRCLSCRAARRSWSASQSSMASSEKRIARSPKWIWGSAPRATMT